MTRKILAISFILASNTGVAREGPPPNWGRLLEKWEAPVLVLLSLALQVILALLANQRKRTNNVVITIIIWCAYMAADSVATLALGVISTNLHDVLKFPGSLDASIELTTFWAPFLLLHLGGQDTITAYALQDTDLWLRHLSYLIVETGMALYIFFGVMKRSRLSTLSAMMLVAGFIKYGERTLCLRLASYNWRRSQALKGYDWDKYLAQLRRSNRDEAQPGHSNRDEAQPGQSNRDQDQLRDSYRDDAQPGHSNRDQAQPGHSNRDQAQPGQFGDNDVENEHGEEILATTMFRKTELMFADVVLHVDLKSFTKRIVQTRSSSVVSKLITMELELMYENLYTKAKVNHSWWGLALRLFSFLLILSTLISFPFSCLHHRHNYSTFQLSVTYLLLVVAILLEGCAAFVFLTSCRTISWLRKHGMNTASKAVKCLSSLRTHGWSNSMGQFSIVNFSVGPMNPFSKVILTFHWVVVVCIMRKPELICYVYERPVKDYVKEGIHEYLNQAEAKYNGSQFSIVNSRGRVPLTTWKEQYGNGHHGRAVDDPTTWFKFDDMELGEMVILWHFVTEVCYYLDYDSLTCEEGSKVYRDWKMSKYLSRYLMHLYVVSSDMLPPRGPLSELKFFNYFMEPNSNANNNRGETSNPEEERNGEAADDLRKETRRKIREAQLFRDSWVARLERRSQTFPVPPAAFKLMKVLLVDDGDPRANVSKKWQLFSEVWIEFLAHLANQCKGNQHAQYLRQGGEFLTHIWVLLGHLGLLEPW